MSLLRRILAGLGIAVVSVGGFGCDRDDTPGEKIGEGIKDAGREIEDATD